MIEIMEINCPHCLHPLKIPVASRENTEDKFPFKCYFCDKSVSYKETFGIHSSLEFKSIKPAKKEMEFIEHQKICEKQIMGKKEK